MRGTRWGTGSAPGTIPKSRRLFEESLKGVSYLWYPHVCSLWILALPGFYRFVESLVDGAENGSTVEDKSPRPSDISQDDLLHGLPAHNRIH